MMAVRWTVLASGSGGNSSLLECQGAALLLDVGIGPRSIATRLKSLNQGWEQIRGVLLTHTHSDHWHEKSLARMRELRIPLFCDREHRRELQLRCSGFQDLQFDGLVRTYEAGKEFSPIEGVRCRPLPVSHDGGPTFGFRLEGDGNLFDQKWGIGYAADLGSWDALLAKGLADVDVLALEFNHDVDLQRASGRAPWLIERVLGDQGHLSNIQGAQLLRECLRHSTPGRVRHVIQLHLSRQCNRPALAVASAREVLAQHGGDFALWTAEQDRAGGTIEIGNDRRGESRAQNASLTGPRRQAIHQSERAGRTGAGGT
jgi:phosphoribosyl 1,2-cyclic phosphodiesterase